MYKLLTILILIASFTSCKPTQVIQTIVKDSIVSKDTTIYVTTTQYLPGETIEMWQAIPCPDAKLDTTIKKGNSILYANISKGILKMRCNTDSLMHVIDSIIQLKNKEVYKTTTVKVPVKVIKYKVPKWCWWLLAFNLVAIGWKFRFKILNLLGA